MGQPIVVVEKASANPAVLRFETNRPLSGMGHERYVAPPEELLTRPVDELARRLFDAGGVDAVHINGSMVTVSLSPGSTGAGLGDVVRRLFRFYGDEDANGSADSDAAAPATDTAASPDAPEGGAAAEPALVETADDVAPAEGRDAETARREAAAEAPAEDTTDGAGAATAEAPAAGGAPRPTAEDAGGDEPEAGAPAEDGEP